jgi:tetratricopeptide (TPR) repeat protein
MLAKPGFEQKHMLEMSYRDLIESKRASSRSIEDILRTAVAALSAFPKNADLWYVTARSLHDAGALDKAAAYYRKAIDFAGTGSEGYQRWSAAGHRRFEIYERLGSALGDLGKKSEAYAALLHALAEKPVDSEGWAELLNLLSALAIDHGDDERLPSLLDRLLARPGAPLDMFFLAVERKAQREGTAAARKMLDEAAARHNRVRASPLYSAAMHKLTALHEA